MKQIKIEIANILWEVLRMNKSTMLWILAPLKTVEQATQMLELKTIDIKTTKQTPIIRKVLEIGN